MKKKEFDSIGIVWVFFWTGDRPQGITVGTFNLFINLIILPIKETDSHTNTLDVIIFKIHYHNN